MNNIAAQRPISSHADMGAGSVPSQTNRQPFAAPTRTPRLLLRASGAPPGPTDGAWWPWTPNLTAELHDLISVLTPRLGQLARLGFAWNAVSLAQRRIDDEDGVQIHGPTPDQPPDTMQLFGTNGTCLTLLVVPADTDPHLADRQMRQAAGRPR
jgi:hypothetical protein